MRFFERLNHLIFPDHQEVTQEAIDYYEQNPDELDLIINKEVFHVAYLSVFFILGLVVTITARTIQYFFGESLGDFINSVILDVLSELGIAIFGGAIVAYLIEFLNKRQYQQNIKYWRAIKSMISQRGLKK